MAEALSDAYDKANRADRIAAFGGAVVFNRPVDRPPPRLISENYLEVVAAPEFEEGTVPILSRRANLRIIRISRIDQLSILCQRSIRGLQEPDRRRHHRSAVSPQPHQDSKGLHSCDLSEYKGKTYTIARKPTEEEYADMLFGWQVEQGVTSNSVIYVKDGSPPASAPASRTGWGLPKSPFTRPTPSMPTGSALTGTGIPYKEMELKIKAGEKDRGVLEEIDEETKKAKGGLIGSTMVSDAFFPFRDGVDVGIKEGVRADGAARGLHEGFRGH